MKTDSDETRARHQPSERFVKVLWLALFAWALALMCSACSSSTKTEETLQTASLAFSTAYQVSWSGNTTAPAGCPTTCGTPAGTSTCICGGQSNACIGGTGWGDKNFADRSPPNAVVTSVHLTIAQLGCGAGTVSAFLNGTRIGAYQPTAACTCNGCDPQQTVTSVRFPNGIPGYNYGGLNTLHLEAQSGSPCIARVDIRVDGTTARLAVTPATFAFGNQRVGSTSTPRSFAVQNQGTEELTVNSFDTAGPFDIVSAPSTPLTLAAGQSANVTVTFSPTGSGAQSGSLAVTSTDPRGPVVVPLSGTGVAPTIDSAPNPRDFGPVDIGGNATGTVTISNTGNDVLNISNISMRGTHATDFVLVSPPQAARIPAGQTLPLTVRFVPTDHGVRTARIVIASDAANEDTWVSQLTGRGQGPAMEVSTDEVEFADANVDTSAPPRTIEVRNVGETPLRIASSIFSNGDFGTSSTFPIDVAPGARAPITLTFRPSAVGARTGTVVLTSNDPSNPTAQIDLSGTGTSPTMAIAPSSIDFGDVRTGTSPVTRAVTLSNTGTGPLVVSRAVLGGPDAARFTLAPITLPLTLEPGDEAMLTVGYAATVVGANTATLTIGSNDPANANVVVPLAGNGVSSMITLLPQTLDFGAHLVGRPSSPRSAEITNTGTAPLTITSAVFGGAQGAMFALSGAPELPTVVAPNAKLALSVIFTGQAAGSAEAELSIANDDPNTPRAVLTLKANAVSQLFATSPTSLDFGTVRVGMTPASKTITVTNTGGDPITVADAVLEGAGAASFEVSPGGGALEPGKSLSVSVTYKANAPAEASAILKIGATDPSLPTAQVAVRGRAVSHLLTADVSALEFGRVKVGEKSPPRSVTVTNHFGEPLEIASISTDSDQFGVNGAPSQVAPGGTASFEVVFQPATPGTVAGKISLRLKDATTDEITIAATGQADPRTGVPVDSASRSDIYGGGCGCRMANHETPVTAFASALAAGLFLLRRRRRP